MSLAVNVALDLVARAGRLLAEVGGRCDVEILEWHHRHKEDAQVERQLRLESE